MKKPNNYCEEILCKYSVLLPSASNNKIIQCAIIDVTHTLESFMDFETYTTDQFTKTNCTDLLNYYNEVLTILKTK